MAGRVAGERQLTGIINVDDGFLAPSSADRTSRSDPFQTVAAVNTGRWPNALDGSSRHSDPMRFAVGNGRFQRELTLTVVRAPVGRR
jgi:hypothetical protein